MSKKSERRVKKIPEGNKKFSANKAVKRATKKQAKNAKRGRVGHSPKPRKVLSKISK